MITPTIGRIVWFYPPPYDDQRHDKSQPLAAIVAYVWHNHMVNLMVTDQNGSSFSATSIQLVQDDEPVPHSEPYCAWMPFQKGQAAKTEALEQKLAG